LAIFCDEADMGKAYGDDLRKKFLSAYDAGDGTLEELAERFVVSLGWAKKISAQRNRTGKAERVLHRPGRKPRVSEQTQQQVVGWVRAQPDLTLAELSAKLHQEASVVLSRGRVWYLVRALGLRLKKVTPRRRARQRSQSQASRGVPRQGQCDRTGEADLS
jgi:transposase